MTNRPTWPEFLKAKFAALNACLGGACTDEAYCDKHLAQAEADHSYLKRASRHAVFNDAQAIEERAQELSDAGRSLHGWHRPLHWFDANTNGFNDGSDT